MTGGAPPTVAWTVVAQSPRVRIRPTAPVSPPSRWASVTFLEPDGDGVNRCALLSKGPGEGLETFLRGVLERWSTTGLAWTRSRERTGGYTLALEGDPQRRFIRRFASGAYLIRLSARELLEMGVGPAPRAQGLAPRPPPPPEWSEEGPDDEL
ncbi:MAG: hypothetical protein KGJ23_03690 [Euryarchaeota archaeon]|nr:hypothetical protein [Euryarchaeota archaeon]MDE1835703.1 hypothetical protein [Euryarchaeota archaeon]MDE1880435.1 hypothetical protein [Euryarchaeota archaeon]MDE2043893.1 hypothetical protein [Thermoplasmata archaeon]